MRRKFDRVGVLGAWETRGRETIVIKGQEAGRETEREQVKYRPRREKLAGGS